MRWVAGVFIISDRVCPDKQYQAVSMNPISSTSTEVLVSSTPQDEEDSGQGSDTDIDAAVEEFRDQVMVRLDLFISTEAA